MVEVSSLSFKEWSVRTLFTDMKAFSLIRLSALAFYLRKASIVWESC